MLHHLPPVSSEIILKSLKLIVLLHFMKLPTSSLNKYSPQSKMAVAKTLLGKLINQAIKQETFPQIFKIAKVILIQKNKGSIHDCANYCSTSLLSTLSKNLETVLKYVHIFKEMISFYKTSLDLENKKSTTVATDFLIDHILEGFAKSGDTYDSCLDLKKAFDWVSDQIILGKLPSYGF